MRTRWPHGHAYVAGPVKGAAGHRGVCAGRGKTANDSQQPTATITTCPELDEELHRLRVAIRGRAVKRGFVVRVHVFTDATWVLAVVALYFIEPAIPGTSAAMDVNPGQEVTPSESGFRPSS